jgi:hypothetical protein
LKNIFSQRTGEECGRKKRYPIVDFSASKITQIPVIKGGKKKALDFSRAFFRLKPY